MPSRAMMSSSTVSESAPAPISSALLRSNSSAIGLLPPSPLPRLVPPEIMPPLRVEAPMPNTPRSSTTQSMPLRRSSSAVDSPP